MHFIFVFILLLFFNDFGLCFFFQFQIASKLCNVNGSIDTTLCYSRQLLFIDHSKLWLLHIFVFVWLFLCNVLWCFTICGYRLCCVTCNIAQSDQLQFNVIFYCYCFFFHQQFFYDTKWPFQSFVYEINV